MKKILISAFGLVLLGSCAKDFSNKDPKAPSIVPSYTLFSNAEKALSDQLASSNVNSGIFRLVVQHWQECTYTDESNYDLGTRNIPQNWWATYYLTVLQDAQASKNLIPTDVLDAGIQKNQLATADILQVYAYYILVATYGNIPYTQALDINNPFPTYDDAATVYADLLSRLNADISALDPGVEAFGSADLLYGGDVSAWIKFANSLKLKMGMLLADSDPATAKSTVESAVAAGVLESNDDNALFHYTTSTPNVNPVWTDLVQSGRKDFVACATLVNALKGLNDPRLNDYFTTDANGDYSGGDPGASSNYATFSKPAEALTAADFPYDVLDYAEVEFLLAEAVERGMNVGGTAESHYNAAITASMEFWGGSASDASAYLAQTSVKYSTAAGDWKEKIGMQKWIALYNRGFDAWTEQRRLDYPELEAPETALSDYPIRYTYPTNEQNLNGPNWKAASAAIGGDEVTTKLFWDKF
ncbi:MAG TPA: SusD/RagB family nutrient-binding outer membrane lipoprotein [Parafilimonas sp.]|nr:SusD/RagB family nutrient-binding outer membrane lipoprotein [Parafilimonas sp.]